MFYSIVIAILDTSREATAKTSLTRYGFEMTTVDYDSDSDSYDGLVSDELKERFDIPDLNKTNKGLGLIMLGATLLLLVKRTSEQGNELYFKKRYMALSKKALADRIGSILITQKVYFTVECAARAHTAINADRQLRKDVFSAIVDSATDLTPLGRILQLVISYMADSEINHIVMIDRYLLTKYPELISIRILRQADAAMNAAFNYLLSIPVARCYTITIEAKSEAIVSLRRNVVTLSIDTPFFAWQLCFESIFEGF